MNDNINPDKVRAADVLMTAYGSKDPEAALARARELEATSSVSHFAKMVREEVERRCLLNRALR